MLTSPQLREGSLSEFRPRMTCLDGLRGLAVLLVIVFHGQRVFAPEPRIPALDAGWIGVDVFFVLSGFLITGILLRTRNHPRYWRNFAIRRALRILPLYGLFLVVILGPRSIAGLDSEVPWWTYPTFVSNYWIGLYGGRDLTLDLTWSLAVEEQFYLVWPIVVYLLDRRQLGWTCMALLVLAPALRAVLHDPATEVTYMWTPCRIDSLAAGALAALALRASHSQVPSAAKVLSIALILPMTILLATYGDLRDNFVFAVFGYSAVAVGMGALLVTLSYDQLPQLARALKCPLLVRLGTVSYGAYLLHGVLAAGISKLGIHWIAATMILVAVTWRAAESLWRTLENPILSRKDRWAPY